MGTMISVLLFTFAAGLIPSFLIRMNNEVAFFTNVRLYIPFEISRFLIESIGIVAAIPISIVVASALFKLQIRKGRENDRSTCTCIVPSPDFNWRRLRRGGCTCTVRQYCCTCVYRDIIGKWSASVFGDFCGDTQHQLYYFAETEWK